MTVRFAPVLIRRMALGIAAAALAGCATTASTPEQAVSQRSAGYWQARQAEDFDKAYAFMPPSYRAVTPLATYRRTFGNAVQLTGAQVQNVVCETQDKCVAAVRLEAKVALRRANTPPIVTYYNEIWIREDSQWWLFPTQ